MLRLNLASGTDIREGWVNLDVVRQWPNTAKACDIIWDARTDPIPFPNDTVDEIYAGYLLLHLPPTHHGHVLAEVIRVLKAGRQLHVREVDMTVVMMKFLQNPFDRRLAELVWGEQGQPGPGRQGQGWSNLAEFDKHCHGFTEGSLIAALSRAGFKNFKVLDKEVFYDLQIRCNKPTPEPAG